MNDTNHHKLEKLDSPVYAEFARPDDAEIICAIRDRAWIVAYPNDELGITAKNIEINAKGLHGEFLPRRIAYLKEKLATQERHDGVTFVAKINDKVVGYVDLSVNDTRRNIDAIYVDPDYQGLGVGGKLMRRALDWHSAGSDIYLEVVAYNLNAIRFYERYGFAKTNNIVPDEPNRPDYMKSLPLIEMVLKSA